MTRKEVLEYFKTISEIRLKNFNITLQYCDANENYIQDFKEKTDIYDMAIEALEKQIPKKPTPVILGEIFKDAFYTCPCCGDDWNVNEYGSAMEYCWTCGQAIDWSEVEENV